VARVEQALRFAEKVIQSGLEGQMGSSSDKCPSIMAEIALVNLHKG
jgi:hypothetical protein